MSRTFDVAIVGAGMAGASLAAEVAPQASVLLLEAEDQPGYHSTGRSAAFWSETYGGPGVQPLTTASRPLLEQIGEQGVLHPRGALHLARREGQGALDHLQTAFAAGEVVLQPLAGAALAARLPGLKPEWNQALFEPSCADIDVAALHGHYLAAARRAWAELATRASLEQAEWNADSWIIRTPSGEHRARILVNAAGAWADQVAIRAGQKPIGITAHRRTIAQLRVDPPVPPDLPLVIDAQERFYFKPAAGGRLWLSPHDETPCLPGDSAPEELDVATAVARLEEVVDWRLDRVERSWAGLRSFAPDRLPVYGFSDPERRFFWCAGQGGFGIQTAPAAAKLAAAVLLDRTPDLSTAHIDTAAYTPQRFGHAVTMARVRS